MAEHASDWRGVVQMAERVRRQDAGEPLLRLLHGRGEGAAVTADLLFTWRALVASPAGPESPTARHVLLTLSLDADLEGGSCFPSTRRLAERTGLSRRCVEDHLRAAEGTWLRRATTGEGQGWKRMSYTLLLPDVEKDVPHEGGAGASPRSGQVGKDVPHVAGERGESDDRKVGNQVPLTTPETTRELSCEYPALNELPRGRQGRVYPDAFEGAFAALPARPRAHPKADTYRAWRARVLDGAEPFRLEAAALAYAEDVEVEGTDPRFVLLGSTLYGPGERWEVYTGIEPRAHPARSTGGPDYVHRHAEV